MKLILVAGTFAGSEDPNRWWRSTSAFAQNLLKHGYELVSLDRPFEWSTDLNWIGKKTDWMAGGTNLFAYAVPPRCPDRQVPGIDLVCAGHSHGGQVIFHAAAKGLKINTLVTVATPVRRDMRAVIAAARPNITFWRHIHGDWHDWVQAAGSFGDGMFGFRRAFKDFKWNGQVVKGADENIKVPGAGHSDFMNDPKFHDRWVTEWLPQVAR